MEWVLFILVILLGAGNANLSSKVNKLESALAEMKISEKAHGIRGKI